MKLADKIVKLRKQQGMSQEALAARLNVSRQTISRWESQTAQPDVTNLLQLSKLLALAVAFFGLLGNFVICVLSRFIEVLVPHITYENGEKWYHWNSGITGYSYCEQGQRKMESQCVIQKGDTQESPDHELQHRKKRRYC